MRGIIYCINTSGVGHFMSMVKLCQGLKEFSQLDLIQGGQTVNMNINCPKINVISLPYYINLNDIKYENKSKILNFLKKRREYLIKNIKGKYDFAIIEQVPFSKHLFCNEVLGLIRYIRLANPWALIFCSQRGFVHKIQEPMNSFKRNLMLCSEKRSVNYINANYNHLLIHSDPQIIRLEDSFFLADDIRVELTYTGFISNPEFVKRKKERKKQIIVFLGSVIYHPNYMLLKKLIAIIPRFPDYLFIFIRGSLWPDFITEQLTKIEKEGLFENFLSLPFVRNFEECLEESSLAITSSGTTIVSLYQAQVPSIVLPIFDDIDQYLFSKRFEEKGIVTTLDPDTVSEDTLVEAISDKLSTPYTPPSCSVDIDGVKNTSNIVFQLTKNKG